MVDYYGYDDAHETNQYSHRMNVKAKDGYLRNSHDDEIEPQREDKNIAQVCSKHT